MPGGPGTPARDRGAAAAIWARAGKAGQAFLARDRLVLAAILLLAAIARFPALATRGDFDGDQGHDMLTLLRFVRDGQIPLLGPPTSIGEFHHGAAYYFLLAPLAWASGSDPLAVMAGIAALGVAAVAVTWWLARAMGGRAAGAIAGLLLAVSPAAVEESTFIWNPNLIPFFAVVALAAAWYGRTSRATRWWTLALASAGVVMQLHVLGIVFLPPIVGFAIAEAVTARRAGDRGRAHGILVAVIAGLAVVALMTIPLAIHEVQTGFLETRRLVDYLTGPGGDASANLDPVQRLAFAALRIVGWPLVGLVTSAPFAAVLVVGGAIVLGAWLIVAGDGEERVAARWLGVTIAWGTVTLSVLAPSLQSVVIGLPNDHYHAFLDPAVVILVALALRAVASGAGLQASVDRTARVLVAGAVIGLVVLDVGRWPPASQANGGWTFAERAGARIAATVPGATFDVRSLPVFKSGEGIVFPIVAAGGRADTVTGAASALRPLIPGEVVVVVCDRLFEAVIGDRCGGPAEAGYLARLAAAGSATGGLVLVDRFDASPRTSVSVYRP